MTNKTIVAVVIQLIAMTWVVFPPMWLARNGTVAYLETEKMDPRALFRGDYVLLGSTLAQDILPLDQAQSAARDTTPVYVTITAERPARFVGVTIANLLDAEGPSRPLCPFPLHAQAKKREKPVRREKQKGG